MTIEEFKAEEPELYQQVFEEGKEVGKEKGRKKEYDRAIFWLNFYEKTPHAAIDGIKEGKDIFYSKS